ncbi:MAG: hypothetical protein KKA28_19180 [Planctomycetes bacterium]|nr:hypothetical protein [Planctomycetota bacterium]MCG2683876.1 hypothetical protein [Planctomycetales bacterium]
MKRLAILLALPLFLTSGVAQALKPLDAGLGLNTVVSPGELKATPEMWFYDQAMQQYNNPKMLVRARAEYRAWQRTRRLESMRWFGFSNVRPRASADPYNGDYSPRWTANPGYFPDRWNGVGQAGAYYVR